MRSEQRARDEVAIRAALSAYEDTWNRHAMQQWGELFTDDVDYVNRAGGLWQGNETNVAKHESIHAALEQQNQKMDWTASLEKVTFLTEDIAVAHATWTWPGFRLPPVNEAGVFRGILTMVMVRTSDRWLIRMLHNTVASAEE